MTRFDQQVIELSNRLGVESSEIYRQVDAELYGKRIHYRPESEGRALSSTMPYWKLLRALVAVGWRLTAEINGCYDRMAKGGN
jgi:hypothetical protein